MSVYREEEEDADKTPERIIIKNTFIEIEEVCKPLARSRSWCGAGYSARDNAPGHSASHSNSALNICFASQSFTSGKRNTVTDAGRPGTSPASSSQGFPEDEDIAVISWPLVHRSRTDHEANNCKPCKFHISHHGCAKGPSCEFCHLPHPKKKRARPSKHARDQCREMLKMVETAFSDDPNMKTMMMAEISKENEYFRRLAKWESEPPRTRCLEDEQAEKAGPCGPKILSRNKYCTR